MTKILLAYNYGHDQRRDAYPDNNTALAWLATYEEALEEVRQALLDLPDPSPLPAGLPAAATSLLYYDGNDEDYSGVALVWGDAPEFGLGETPSSSLALIVDGVPYEIEDFEAVIDRDPDLADKLRAEQEASR